MNWQDINVFCIFRLFAADAWCIWWAFLDNSDTMWAVIRDDIRGAECFFCVGLLWSSLSSALSVRFSVILGQNRRPRPRQAPEDGACPTFKHWNLTFHCLALDQGFYSVTLKGLLRQRWAQLSQKQPHKTILCLQRAWAQNTSQPQPRLRNFKAALSR